MPAPVAGTAEPTVGVATPVAAAPASGVSEIAPSVQDGRAPEAGGNPGAAEVPVTSPQTASAPSNAVGAVLPVGTPIAGAPARISAPTSARTPTRGLFPSGSTIRPPAESLLGDAWSAIPPLGTSPADAAAPAGRSASTNPLVPAGPAGSAGGSSLSPFGSGVGSTVAALTALFVLLGLFLRRTLRLAAELQRPPAFVSLLERPG
jgi:hypothetical protein